MKRFLTILITLTVVLGLCACTDTAQTDPTASTATTPSTGGIVDSNNSNHIHDYFARQQSATCTEDGKITYSCACGDSYSETLLAIGHYFGDLIITEPSSTTQMGTGKRVCNSCGDEEFEELPINTLEQEVQYFVEELMLELPAFTASEDLSGGAVFNWIVWHIPHVSREMDDKYMITTVYSMDEMDSFTQKYLGQIYNYTYLAEPNKDFMTFDLDKREITVVTGAAGGGGYRYSIEELTDHGDGTYSARYLAVDLYMEDAFEKGYYHYGNLNFMIVDGHIQITSHTKEAK